MTSEDQSAVERTAELTKHIDRELQALGPGAALAVPYLIGWIAGQLGEAAGLSGATADNTAAFEPILAFIRRAWADGVKRGAARRGTLH